VNNTECQSVVVGLDHVQLAMPKGQERLAEEFYCQLLGFQKVQKPSHLEQRGGCWFTANGVSIHLGVDPQFVPARKAHPGFVVKSLAEVKNRLEAAGIEIVLDTQISGFERFYASDPFGNRLEFMEPIKSSSSGPEVKSGRKKSVI
jgi:catechol 2,3-dioxygenase-like lactoylglutathione lyase family enzyme